MLKYFSQLVSRFLGVSQPPPSQQRNKIVISRRRDLRKHRGLSPSRASDLTVVRPNKFDFTKKDLKTQVGRRRRKRINLGSEPRRIKGYR